MVCTVIELEVCLGPFKHSRLCVCVCVCVYVCEERDFNPFSSLRIQLHSPLSHMPC